MYPLSDSEISQSFSSVVEICLPPLGYYWQLLYLKQSCIVLFWPSRRIVSQPYFFLKLASGIVKAGTLIVRVTASLSTWRLAEHSLLELNGDWKTELWNTLTTDQLTMARITYTTSRWGDCQTWSDRRDRRASLSPSALRSERPLSHVWPTRIYMHFGWFPTKLAVLGAAAIWYSSQSICSWTLITVKFSLRLRLLDSIIRKFGRVIT